MKTVLFTIVALISTTVFAGGGTLEPDPTFKCVSISTVTCASLDQTTQIKLEHTICTGLDFRSEYNTMTVLAPPFINKTESTRKHISISASEKTANFGIYYSDAKTEVLQRKTISGKIKSVLILNDNTTNNVDISTPVQCDRMATDFIPDLPGQG